MTRPPTLPLLAPGEAEWTEVQRVWAGTEETEKRLEVLRPFLAEAIRSLAIKQDLLLDEAWATLLAGTRAAKRSSLPSNPKILQLHLASTVLRVAADERSALNSRLHDPMAAWHAFRQRVNRLRRSFRRYLLASLPRHSVMPFLDVRPRREPTAHWVRLWDKLVEGIPDGCLPREWCMIRATAESDVLKVEQEILLTPGHGLAPRRDWKELLARPLHRAAALLESRRPAKVDLILPKGVIPERPKQFAQKFLNGLAPYGDLPSGDESLEAAMDLMRRMANPTIGEVGGDSSALDLARLAENLGFSRFKSGLFMGSIWERSDDPHRAIGAFRQGLTFSTSRRTAAEALTNLAVRMHLLGDREEARRLLFEALVYCPDSWFVRRNSQALQALWQAEMFEVQT